jgi:PAS domain S-box-containing protein
LPEPIEDQESVFQAILESTPTQLAYLDWQLNIVWVNDAYARGSGYAREELIGRNHFELFPNADNQATFEKVRDTGEPITVHARPFRYAMQPERGVTYWDWTLAPIKEVNGDVTGLVLSLQDVTEQVQAQKQNELHVASLDAMVAQLDTTIAAIADAVVIYDATGQILRMNRSAERILGYSPADSKQPFVERVVLIKVTGIDGQPFASVEDMPAGRALRGETVRNVTMALRNTQTNQPFWISASAAPIWAPDGSLLGAVASFSDVTELHQARNRLEQLVDERTAELAAAVEALRASEERFRHAFEYAAFGMALVDIDGQFLEVNPSLCAMFGYAAPELLERTFQDLTHPDDVTVGVELFRDLVAGKKAYGWLQKRYIHKDGQTIWTLLSTSVVRDIQGAPAFLVSQIQDITDRKAAEEELKQTESRFRSLFDNSPLGVAVSRQGITLDANPVYARMFGYDEASELVGTSLLDQIAPQHRPEIIERVQKRERGDVVPSTYEVLGQKRDGSLFPFQIYTARIPLPDGEATVGFFLDVSERKRAEQLVQQHIMRLETLRKIDRAVLTIQPPAEIAAAVLHHLRELLTQCSGVNLVLFDLENQRGTVLAVDAGRQTEFGPGKHLPLDLAGDLQSLRQDQVYMIDDAQAIPQPSPALRTVLASGLRSYMCVPLIVQDDLVGSLNLRSDLARAFAPEDVEIAREVARPLAIAIQQARLSEELRESNERLQALSRRLVEAQEKERRRLARELHDEIGQAMTAVKISLQTAQRRANAGIRGPELEQSIAIVDRALQQVRDVSLDLRPSLLDDLGLVATLRWYLDRHTQSEGSRASLHVNPPELRLPSELEVVFFRVVQEALTNVTRHARAQTVQVKLQLHEEAVELTVRDDGAGFDLQDALESARAGTSMGLLGMQERVLLAGGEIDIVSSPGHGTEIRVHFAVTQ